jgi:PKD repeat protein
MGRLCFWKLLVLGALAALLAGCKPIPMFSFEPNPATAGVEITFDGSGSMVSPEPSGNTAVSYTWDFGDGQTRSGAVVRHTYASAGQYTVTLTVTDGQARVGTRSEVLEVSASTQLPGPRPVPTTLWQPAAGSTPASGNYVYLQSQPGDYIGQGRSHVYTQKDAVLRVSHAQGLLSVAVTGVQTWAGEFKVRTGLAELQAGYYGGLTRYPFHDLAWGGLSWSGDGRGCNTLTGWFVVDSVRYESGTLQSIELRFEQHCEGGLPALNGKIHWDAADTTGPGGPIAPPPADLWQPPAGAVPGSGNYVYLHSEAGDYIGQGQTLTYTQGNALLSVTADGGLLSVRVQGNQNWSGSFKAMDTLSELTPGYYPNLGRFPFHNPTAGGLEWAGDGRGCNSLTGWFVVDRLVQEGGMLKAVDLRFEQHCEGAAPALRGKIHWEAGDTVVPPGPVNPPPPGLWAPDAGALPTSGNYVYLSSETGDYIGQGRSFLYTPDTATLSVTARGAGLSVAVTGPAFWSGDFVPMNTLQALQPGYYGDLVRYPFHNPALGGLSWSGEGRGCNTLKGWFVVDAVTHDNGLLKSIDLRFSQNCEGGPSALRGKLRWVSP